MTFQKTFKPRYVGSKYSLDYRVYLENESGKVVSPFHDIPLHANEEQTVFNMVVEIPRWSNAKLEIATGEYFNPIKQDVKKGQLRFVKNCFPHHGYIWNYGAFPQTWEDPNHIDADTKCGGDNDPVDVVEIGEGVGQIGEVKQVKVLGLFGLIDDGETDWKVVAIDVKDPLADHLNDIKDVEKHCPGLLKATYEWFKIYKIPDGKPENQFAFNGSAMDKNFALNIIKDTHQSWKKLIENKVAKKTDKYDHSTTNVSVAGSPYLIPESDDAYLKLPKADGKADNPLPQSLNKSYFISGAPNL